MAQSEGWTRSDIEFHLHKLAGLTEFEHLRRQDVIRGHLLTQFTFCRDNLGFLGGVQNGLGFFIFVADNRGGARARYPLSALLAYGNANFISSPEFDQLSHDALVGILPDLIVKLEGPKRDDVIVELDRCRALPQT